MIQTQLLLDILRENPDLILTNKLAGLQRFWVICADITSNKKLYNEAISAKLKEQVAALRVDPFFQESARSIQSSLT